MYRCTDCKGIFMSARSVYEHHGLAGQPYERRLVCPICGGEEFVPLEAKHCRCCGARLPAGRYEYCNDECRRRGERLWKKQRERRKQRELNPLNMLVAEAQQYNREHGTDYSYGHYVAYVKGKEQTYEH